LPQLGAGLIILSAEQAMKYERTKRGLPTGAARAANAELAAMATPHGLGGFVFARSVVMNL
jgi:hypothetical protein